ncbi:MAG: helix-turn-helix transcriptional regulator, partial [Turicibacter sp.]
MNLKIGRKIYTLRKAMDLTQEQLAHTVGVSTVAVSKWENEQSYPDITLLPPLARIFDISVDELLSYEKELSIDDVLLLEKDCISIFQTKGLDEGLRYCDMQLKQYPNNLYLKLRLAFVYQQYFHHAKSEDIMLEIINKAIDLFKAAAKSDDLDILQAANLGL